MAERLVTDRYKAQPLSGRRVVVTRPEEQAKPLADALAARGAVVSIVPLIAIEPVDDVASLEDSIRGAHQYDWLVVTSATTVAVLGQWSGFARLARSVRVAAVGPATATALERVGVEPDFIPQQFAASEIAAGLGPLEGIRLLLPQADIADPGLADTLRKRGASVDVLIAYRTVEADPRSEGVLELQEADAVVLASGSAARSLARLQAVGDRTLVACIGPKTADAAREAGLEVGLVAEESTSEGIIQALVAHYEGLS